MNFDRYRETMTQVQKLADNFSSLKKADLTELHRLNVECLSLGEEIVNSFTTLVEEIEDGLTLLLDRLEQIKKDLGRISGPDGTLGDILLLEPAWSQANTLRGSIRALLHPAGSEAVGKDTPGPEKEGKEVQELIGLARKEAAAASEKSEAAKTPPPVRIQKKEEQEQSQKKNGKITPADSVKKPAPLNLNKNAGDAEKKLMAEITKNIEAIKSSKKKI